MKRIVTRLITLAVIYAIMVYILPALIDLASSVSTFFRLIPSWGYYTCCGIAFIFFVLMFITQYQLEKDREKVKHFYQETLNEFENRINNSPVETKKMYLELRAAIRNHDEATAVDLAEKVYGRRRVHRGLIEELEKKLDSIETNEITEAIEIYMQKLRDNPDEARRMADDLSNALLFERVEPKLVIKLSQTLFDGKVFVYHPTINRITWGCYNMIQDNAVNEIKEKMSKNPELTRKIYHELEDALKDTKNSELIYELCEKLFGNRFLPINRISIPLIYANKYIEGNQTEP